VQRSSVGIGVSGGGGERSRLPKSRSTEHNRRAIEAEVTEKALPETTRVEVCPGGLVFEKIATSF
jgi:hypothetical protein